MEKDRYHPRSMIGAMAAVAEGTCQFRREVHADCGRRRGMVRDWFDVVMDLRLPDVTGLDL
jgi:hypothetical protein